MEQVGDMMNELLAQSGVAQADVFGLHTGHKVAVALAARHPTRVRRLILCGKTHGLIAQHERSNAAMKARVSTSRRGGRRMFIVKLHRSGGDGKFASGAKAVVARG